MQMLKVETLEVEIDGVCAWYVAQWNGWAFAVACWPGG
jgi:hypothetical protein